MERIVDVIYRVSYRMLCDRVDSENVTRRVLAEASGRSVVYDGSDTVTDWFLRRTCFHCRMMLVRRRMMWLLDSPSEVFVRASPKVDDQDDYVTKQAWQVYCRAAFNMSPIQIAAYVLVVFEGLTADRAASVLRLSRHRVEHLLDKATASIRGELAVYGSAGLYRNFVGFIMKVDEARKPQAKDLLTEYSDSAP